MKKWLKLFAQNRSDGLKFQLKNKKNSNAPNKHEPTFLPPSPPPSSPHHPVLSTIGECVGANCPIHPCPSTGSGISIVPALAHQYLTPINVTTDLLYSLPCREAEFYAWGPALHVRSPWGYKGEMCASWRDGAALCILLGYTDNTRVHRIEIERVEYSRVLWLKSSYTARFMVESRGNSSLVMNEGHWSIGYWR